MEIGIGYELKILDKDVKIISKEEVWDLDWKNLTLFKGHRYKFEILD